MLVGGFRLYIEQMLSRLPHATDKTAAGKVAGVS